MKISLALLWQKRGLPTWCALLGTLITVLTVQGIPETAAASLRRNDPGTIQPGRRVADVLLVPTFQVRHPLLRLILMKTDDLALHSDLTGGLEA
jgi:hypothetical protein